MKAPGTPALTILLVALAVAPVLAQDKPKAAKPEPTGLERLSADWPSWLKVNFLYRGRVESVRGVGSVLYDGYYLNRLRFGVAVVPASWFQAVAQIQDAEVLGWDLAVTPTTVSGGFDLRQGYVEVGRRGPKGFLVSGGRMEYSLGDGRLMASPDWGNSSRTYDMGRVAAAWPGLKVEVFRAAPVALDAAKFDRAKPGEFIWGEFATVDRFHVLGLLDAYAYQKAQSVVAGELGSKGEGRVYTYGARLARPVGKRFAVDAGGAIQRGTLAADGISAWAANASLAWTLSLGAAKPRLTFEYDRASGDANGKDGRRGTFDQLYASNHAKYGQADLVGWRNMVAAQARFEVFATKKFRLNAAVVHLWLATVADAWYGTNGSKIVLNTKATSRDLGWEGDLSATYTVSKEMSLGAGIGGLAPGEYVHQSVALDRLAYPYAMWTLRF